jgi:hypothetical protein
LERTPLLPRYTAVVVVTAMLDWSFWAEWRLLVGRGYAEVTERGAAAPARIEELLKERTREVRARVAELASTSATASSRATLRGWRERSSERVDAGPESSDRRGAQRRGGNAGGGGRVLHEVGAEGKALMPDLDLIRLLSPLGVGGCWRA